MYFWYILEFALSENFSYLYEISPQFYRYVSLTNMSCTRILDKDSHWVTAPGSNRRLNMEQK